MATRFEQVVCFTPMSGLLSQEKCLPIRYCPLQLELEIVGRANEASDGTSPVFTLTDVQFKVDFSNGGQLLRY